MSNDNIDKAITFIERVYGAAFNIAKRSYNGDATQVTCADTNRIAEMILIASTEFESDPNTTPVVKTTIPKAS